jgi:hypothetical protein
LAGSVVVFTLVSGVVNVHTVEGQFTPDAGVVDGLPWPLDPRQIGCGNAREQRGEGAAVDMSMSSCRLFVVA